MLSLKWYFTIFFRLAICAKVFISLSIFLTYPLHFYVVIDIITRHVIRPYVKEKYVNIAGILSRVAIVVVCGKYFNRRTGTNNTGVQGKSLLVPLIEAML